MTSNHRTINKLQWLFPLFWNSSTLNQNWYQKWNGIWDSLFNFWHYMLGCSIGNAFKCPMPFPFNLVCMCSIYFMHKWYSLVSVMWECCVCWWQWSTSLFSAACLTDSARSACGRPDKAVVWKPPLLSGPCIMQEVRSLCSIPKPPCSAAKIEQHTWVQLFFMLLTSHCDLGRCSGCRLLFLVLLWLQIHVFERVCVWKLDSAGYSCQPQYATVFYLPF